MSPLSFLYTYILYLPILYTYLYEYILFLFAVFLYNLPVLKILDFIIYMHRYMYKLFNGEQNAILNTNMSETEYYTVLQYVKKVEFYC